MFHTFPKKLAVPIVKILQQHLSFTIFLLVLVVGEVCDISNKC